MPWPESSGSQLYFVKYELNQKSQDTHKDIFIIIIKKGKRKVQEVPQSQTSALPRPQEEEETDKSKQAQTKQTYEKH